MQNCHNTYSYVIKVRLDLGPPKKVEIILNGNPAGVNIRLALNDSELCLRLCRGIQYSQGQANSPCAWPAPV